MSKETSFDKSYPPSDYASDPPPYSSYPPSLSSTSDSRLSTQQQKPPVADQSSDTQSWKWNHAKQKPRPEAAFKWGITPRHPPPGQREKDPAKCPPDHPVHKYSQKQIEKMRKKGVNPVFKAELDQDMANSPGGGFWNKVFIGSQIK